MARAATSLEPPVILQASLIEWGANLTLYRVHHQRFHGPDFNPTQRGNARFSPIYEANGVLIPTLYAGTTLDCALMETVFHDVPYKAGFKYISLDVLDEQVHSSLVLSRSLHLIDLGTVALHKLGIKRTELIDTTKSHHSRTRRWAEALYMQFAGAEGLRWTSRQDDRAHAVVLFGSRLSSNDLSMAGEPTPLMSAGEVILPVLELAMRLGVVLTD